MTSPAPPPIDIPYPDSPADVPPDLRRPSARYRRRALAAGVALAAFLIAYLGLMLWFGWTGVQLVWSAIVVKEHEWGWAAGGAALIIAGALASSFLRPRPRPSLDGPLEVTAADQPTLLAFVRRVAAEIGAPPPDRVQITAAVAASVVHEPGRWWRLERSRRTLTLGLGLVAGLDLREFKALLAHELGHLGHHSTWLGRWSTRAGRLADMLIDPRPWFRNGWTSELSEVPVGGVGLGLLVLGAIVYGLAWAIRAVTMTLFGCLALHLTATATDALADLAAAVRDELLATEERVVALATAPPDEPVVAPIIAQVPDRYPLHVREVARPAAPPPTLRERWRRPLRAVARIAAATVLVGGTAIASHYLRRVDVVAYNGTGGPVTVTIDGERRAVAAGDYATFKVGAGRIAVSAQTADGTPIETFHERIDERHRYVYDVAAALPLFETTVVYAERVAYAPRDDDGPPPRALPLHRWQAVDADWLFTTPPQTKQVSRDKGQASFTRVRGLDRDDPGSVARALDELGAFEGFAAVVEAQLRWRPSEARFTAAWWDAGADLGGFAGLLERRLARSPDDPLLRTIEQDHAGARRAAVCADHRARAAARPDDPTWQYLAARCLPLDDRAAAMDAARQRWLDAPWVTLGAGQAAAARGQYATAAGLLATACRALPNHCDQFALDVARARRATADGTPAFTDLPLADGPDAYLVTPPPDAWWRTLAAGRLDAAVANASGVDPRDGAQARWLAAASAGATPEHLADAEAHAADAASTPTVALLAFALRHRAGRVAATDLDEAAHAATSDGGADADAEAAAVRGFLTLLTAADGAHVDAAAAALADVRLVVRGRAYAAAVVLMGAACPPLWRLRATLLLFDHERPAFPPD